MADLVYALRSLRKNPWFLAAVVAILGLGIVANTAVFSIADAVLLRPAPYQAADRLVTIEQRTPKTDISVISSDDYLFWENRHDLFDKIVPYINDIVVMTKPGDPDQVFAVRTSVQLFSLLGVRASLGRTLLDSDDAPLGQKSAVISDRFWRRKFNANPGVIGRTVQLSGEAFTIVGVMPPEFEFPYPQEEVWVPMRLRPGAAGALEVVARLRPGVTASQAESAMRVVARELEQRDPIGKAGLRISVTPWSETVKQHYERYAILILAASGLVLLIASANVSSLLLSRAVHRQREIAIRASLGAGFWRLARELLTESLLLAGTGSLAGLALARPLLRLLLRQLTALPFALPHLQSVTLNGHALWFEAAVCLFLGCISSVAPIAFASRTRAVGVFGGSHAGGRRPARLFSILIASEAAFAFLLLAGAALLIRSLVRLERADTGFHADHVLTMRVPIGTQMQPNPAGRYDTRTRQIEFYRQVLERLATVPGVRAVAVVNNLPLSEANTTTVYRTPDGEPLGVMTRTVSEQYFSVMGIRLLQGRTFSESDGADTPLVAIVNEYLAHMFFPDRNPLGEFLPGDSPRKVMVVGVVRNSWRRGYDERAAGEVYIPYRQYIFGTFLSTIVARTSADPLALADTLRRQIWSVDPSEPVLKVETMDDVIAESFWRPRFSVWIFGALGGLALILTSAGIYGVVAYTTALRSMEVGIRVALGAAPWNVTTAAVGTALTPLTVGLIAGFLGALLLSRLLASLLYETSQADPLAYISAAALLLLVGVAASLQPALRAASANPLRSLRTE